MTRCYSISGIINRFAFYSKEIDMKCRFENANSILIWGDLMANAQ